MKTSQSNLLNSLRWVNISELNNWMFRAQKYGQIVCSILPSILHCNAWCRATFRRLQLSLSKYLCMNTSERRTPSLQALTWKGCTNRMKSWSGLCTICSLPSLYWSRDWNNPLINRTQRLRLWRTLKCKQAIVLCTASPRRKPRHETGLKVSIVVHITLSRHRSPPRLRCLGCRVRLHQDNLSE